jgi:hypothetical protein
MQNPTAAYTRYRDEILSGRTRDMYLLARPVEARNTGSTFARSAGCQRRCCRHCCRGAGAFGDTTTLMFTSGVDR